MSNGALSQNANSVDDRTAKRAAAKASQTTILRREIGWRLKANTTRSWLSHFLRASLHWSRNSKVFPPIPNNRSRYAAFSIRVDSLNHPGRGHVADNARGLNRGAVHQPQRYVPTGESIAAPIEGRPWGHQHQPRQQISSRSRQVTRPNPACAGAHCAWASPPSHFAKCLPEIPQYSVVTPCISAGRF